MWEIFSEGVHYRTYNYTTYICNLLHTWNALCMCVVGTKVTNHIHILYYIVV